MLPNFLVIGAVKAGTTWLASCLRDHPDIFMSAVKEVKYFTLHFEKGIDWYKSHFTDWSGQAAIGEATPLYLAKPDVPHRIQAALGDQVKLIVSLRHPVDRAYSAFWFQNVRRKTISPGDDFLTVFRQGKLFRKPGLYFQHLNRYSNYFSRENFLILIYEEDVVQNSQQGLSKCFNFLNVDAEFVPDKINTKVNKAGDVRVFHNQIWALRRTLRLLPTEILSPISSKIRKPLEAVGSQALELMPKKQSGYESLDKNLRQELLNEYYMADIRQLEDLLKRDLSVWYGSV